MQLTEADVGKYQKLHRQHFGIEVSHDEAREQLTALVRLVELTYKPITTEQLAALKNEDEQQITTEQES
jgi:hypothetical protein